MKSIGLSSAQAQTQETFSFKWAKSDTYSSEHLRDEWRRWLLEKYFDGDENGPASFLGSQKLRILDAGCGAGISALLLFGESLATHEYVGVDISDAVVQGRRNFEDLGIPAYFEQANLQELPEDIGKFDVIFSEGVLHHTDGVQDSLTYLASRLKPGGRIAFYVYARKAPIREFTDDLVRDAISAMTDEEAWAALMPLTKLGKALGDLGITIEVPEDVPALGIEKGSYDLQRLFFYKICKAYFRSGYSLEEMNHFNFDWFRPKNCHRHSPEEVRAMCHAADLTVTRMHVEPSGITVIAER